MVKNVNRPIVSVIIPTYNRADFLLQSVGSVLQQTFVDFELIVVDDASTDSTKELLQSIRDKRIKYIRNERNLSVSASRNHGISHARGRFISFLDSDDLWENCILETQVHIAEKFDRQNLWLIYTQFYVCGEQPDYVLPKQAKMVNEPMSEYLFCQGGYVLPSGIMIPNCSDGVYRFSEEQSIHEDADLCLRLDARAAHFHFIDKPMWRWNNDFREDRLTMKINGVEQMNWLIKEWDLLTPAARITFIRSFILRHAERLEHQEYVRTKIASFIQEKRITIQEGLSLLKDSFNK